jgi:hypothetical protein
MSTQQASLKLMRLINGYQVSQVIHVAASISPDQFQPRETSADLVEDQAGPVAVLDRGGMDDDLHWQPFAVDQSVELAAPDLLAGVVTHLAMYSSAQIASQTSSRWNLRKML